MKILLTGANGFVGSRFFREYKDQYDIVALGHKDLDIGNEKDVIELVKGIKPDVVINTAAISDTSQSQLNPELSYNVNVLGPENLAKSCQLIGSKLLHLSSDQVYNGNKEDGPYSEEVIATPAYVYGKHKLEAENRIKAVLEENWCLRLTWLFGLPEKGCRTNSNIIWNSMNTIMKNQKHEENTNSIRGITYVYDLIHNMTRILDIPYGIYNAGSENNLNQFEVIGMVFKTLGFRKEFDELIHPTSGEEKDLRINTNKIKDQHIKFMTIEEGIKKCIRDYGVSMS